jgi:hypothetical protein
MSGAHLLQRRARAVLSNAEKVARRARAIKRIHELLAEKRMSAYDLAGVLGHSSQLVYDYLRQMAELGEARRSGSYDNRRRELWDLGAEDASKLEVHAMRPQGAVIVPAVQMGMARHWMDVALFGPARGAAA